MKHIPMLWQVTKFMFLKVTSYITIREYYMQKKTLGNRAESLTSARNKAESTTVKKGSIDLIVWVNETATFPRLMLVKRFPIVCTTASGKITAN